MAFILRPDQVIAVRDSLNFLSSVRNGAGIVVAPTSFGKSLVVSELAHKVNQPVVVLQPNKELLAQNYAKYKTYSDNAGVFSASFGKKEVRQVTFATIGSVVKHAGLFKKIGVKLLIMDECHIGSGKSNQVYEFCANVGITHVLGLTATPLILKSSYMGGGHELVMLNRTRKSFFSKIIHVTQISRMTDQGYWTKVNFVEHQGIDTSVLESNSTGTDYTEWSMKKFNEVNGINKKIAESVFRLKSNGRKKILVFVTSVDQAYEVSSLIKDSQVVHGGLDSKSRDMILKNFTTMDTKTWCVINVNVLGVGFDFPQLDGAVHARPTNSVALWYQHVGRFVRIHPDKESADFIDLSGNYRKFGDPKDFTFEEDPVHKWAMFAGNRKLTGVDLKYGKPEYKTVVKEKKVQNHCENEYGSYLWTFGKHKDKKISEIPDSYLEWVASENFDASYESGKIAKQKAIEYLKLKSDGI